MDFLNRALDGFTQDWLRQRGHHDEGDLTEQEVVDAADAAVAVLDNIMNQRVSQKADRAKLSAEAMRYVVKHIRDNRRLCMERRGQA